MAMFDPNKKITTLMKKIYPTLTDRESLCLFWMCLNLSKKEVARKLTISENTVKYHIKSVLEKQDNLSLRDIKITFLTNVILFSLFN